MKAQTTKNSFTIKTGLLAFILGLAVTVPPYAMAAESTASSETKSLTGEVVDLMCYLDHGAKGEKHKGCARKCIEGGGPVGLLSGEDLYLVVGDHQPINDKLASKAGETVTLKGKVVERHGMKMIENVELEKK